MRFCLCLTTLTFLLAPMASATESTRDMLYRLPAQVNAVVLVNMDAVIKSPRGQRENWEKSHQSEVLGGAIPLNPNIDKIVLGSHFDPAQTQSPWSIALVGLNQKTALQDIAAARNARMETISGLPIAVTPQLSFTEIKPGVIIGMSGLSRPEFSRNLKFAKENTKFAISNYLANAVQKDIRTPIVIAFDLDDAMDAQTVAKVVQSSKALENNKDAIDAISKFVGDLKGITISIQIGESFKATVSVDGSAPYTGDPEALKAFFLETMGNWGANLEVLGQAVPRPVDKSVTFVSDLSENGLMRLMSVLHFPPPPEGAKPVHANEEKAREAQIAATKRYYLAITSMLNDLDAEYKRSKNYNSTARWHEGYAQKIEALSTVDVDQSVVAYGAAVAHDLKALAASLKGIPLQIQKLENNIQITVPFIGGGYGGLGRWGGGAYVYIDTNVGQVRQQQTEAVEKGRNDRDLVWKQLQSDREQIRQRIQDKYGINLDARGK